MEPLYKPGANAHSVLRYGWTGWPKVGSAFPAEMENFLSVPSDDWERDGLRMFEFRFSTSEVQMTFGLKPHVTPILFTGRVKGRLDHAFRKAGLHAAFSRKVSMRSIGENHRADVEAYIESQVGKERLIDAERLADFTVINRSVDLSQPTETSSGRYWYNLHLVLVNDGRWRNSDIRWLGKIRDQSLAVAAEKDYAVSRLAVLPDHLHVSLRGNLEHSPEQIALAFQNDVARVLGNLRVWQETYHVGTFGEYDMDAVRSWERRR